MQHISIEKHYIDIIQAVVTCLALIAGGAWTYMMFIQKRHKYPRAEITHTIHQRQLGNDLTLVRVEVTLENLGEVLISTEYIDTWINQVRPVPLNIEVPMMAGEPLPYDSETEIQWPLVVGTEAMKKVQSAEMEPKEKELFLFDFVLTQPVTTIQIYSYVRNKAKKKPSFWEDITAINDGCNLPKERDIGWCRTTLYDLKEVD